MKAMTTSIRLSIPVAIVAALTATLLGPQLLTAQTPEAPPEASPVAGAPLPDGPLGDQIQWLLDTANAGAGSITTEQIDEHFDGAFIEEVTIEEILSVLSGLQLAGVTYEIEPNSVITTMDLPATNGRFILVGSDGSRTEVSVQIERDAGLIVGLLIQPASEATPEASPAA
ncbi:MAG: Cpe/LpqF family protein [Chloroflexota bacterium]|nr:Cpe/LpqF family protein [Chloroflexota bacterium]